MTTSRKAPVIDPNKLRERLKQYLPFIYPTVLLNPVLVLHALNGVLTTTSWMLPQTNEPQVVSHPSPLKNKTVPNFIQTIKENTTNNADLSDMTSTYFVPHINVHSNHNFLAWYTFIMICVQFWVWARCVQHEDDSQGDDEETENSEKNAELTANTDEWKKEIEQRLLKTLRKKGTSMIDQSLKGHGKEEISVVKSLTVS